MKNDSEKGALTEMEIKLLQLLSDGESSKKSAEIAGISQSYAYQLQDMIRAKMRARTLAQCVALAVNRGLVKIAARIHEY